LISLPRKGVFRRVFLANHLATTDNLTKTTKGQNVYEHKLILTQKVAIINDIIHTQKKLMLRENRQPGLVAFYDIWPGNGAGLFFQPRTLTGLVNREV